MYSTRYRQKTQTQLRKQPGVPLPPLWPYIPQHSRHNHRSRTHHVFGLPVLCIIRLTIVYVASTSRCLSHETEEPVCLRTPPGPLSVDFPAPDVSLVHRDNPNSARVRHLELRHHMTVSAVVVSAARTGEPQPCALASKKPSSATVWHRSSYALRVVITNRSTYKQSLHPSWKCLFFVCIASKCGEHSSLLHRSGSWCEMSRCLAWYGTVDALPTFADHVSSLTSLC